jgi:hypothetical protein
MPDKHDEKAAKDKGKKANKSMKDRVKDASRPATVKKKMKH